MIKDYLLATRRSELPLRRERGGAGLSRGEGICSGHVKYEMPPRCPSGTVNEQQDVAHLEFQEFH